MIAIVLPRIPAIAVTGSADVVLFDLDQDELKLRIAGSGDIEASGKVQRLEVEIEGSGDVNVRELLAQDANIWVAGSGDVNAMIEQGVRVRVFGSGNVNIRGNPPQRDHQVSGLGDVKFK